MTSILDLRVFTMPLSLILRLFATAVLAGAGVTASASMSWAELRPMIAFEMSAGELEPAARSFHGQWVSLSPEERQQMTARYVIIGATCLRKNGKKNARKCISAGNRCLPKNASKSGKPSGNVAAWTTRAAKDLIAAGVEVFSPLKFGLPTQ